MTLTDSGKVKLVLLQVRMVIFVMLSPSIVCGWYFLLGYITA